MAYTMRKTSTTLASVFEKRQSIDGTNAGEEYYWNYSTTAIAIKWTVIGAIILLILLWFVGGYYHAQRRIRNGKRPLAYHLFLVPRAQRVRFFPQPNPVYYNPQQGVYRPQEYPLQPYPPPPPAYTADQYAPPEYQPPGGGSKVNPHQDYTAPPPGAPPGEVERGESSQTAAGPTTGVTHEDARSVTHGAQSSPTPQEAPRSGMLARINPFKNGAIGRGT